jgi:hypothetical protein
MKSITAIALMGFATVSTAQSGPASGEIEVTIEMVRSVMQLERKAIIAEVLELTATENMEFWPVYDDYRDEVRLVDDRLLALILSFAESYDNLPDETAVAMVDNYFEIEMDRLKVRTKFLRRFDDVLPPKKLARFVQTENKIDVITELDLARQIPLVE